MELLNVAPCSDINIDCSPNNVINASHSLDGIINASSNPNFRGYKFEFHTNGEQAYTMKQKVHTSIV